MHLRNAWILLRYSISVIPPRMRVYSSHFFERNGGGTRQPLATEESSAFATVMPFFTLVKYNGIYRKVGLTTGSMLVVGVRCGMFVVGTLFK